MKKMGGMYLKKKGDKLNEKGKLDRIDDGSVCSRHEHCRSSRFNKGHRGPFHL